MLCVVGHAGALTRRAGPSTDHSNPNTNYNVSISIHPFTQFQHCSPSPRLPPRVCARDGDGGETRAYTRVTLLSIIDLFHYAHREMNASFCTRVVLSSFCCWFVGSSILLILDMSHGINDDISNTTIAATVAFCSHISLFLLSFLWILFLIRETCVANVRDVSRVSRCLRVFHSR